MPFFFQRIVRGRMSDSSDRPSTPRSERVWEILIETRTELRNHIDYCKERDRLNEEWHRNTDRLNEDWRREVDKERNATRKLMLRLSWSVVPPLLTIIAYLLINGVPWGAAIKAIK